MVDVKTHAEAYLRLKKAMTEYWGYLIEFEFVAKSGLLKIWHTYRIIGTIKYVNLNHPKSTEQPLNGDKPSIK